MEVRVEAVAFRVELLDAVLFQRADQRALGHLDAVDEAGQTTLAIGLGFGRHGFQRAAQIVGDRQDLAGKAGHRVGARILDLALGPPAQVLHVGGQPQQAILDVGVLGFQRGDALGIGAGGGIGVGKAAGGIRIAAALGIGIGRRTPRLGLARRVGAIAGGRVRCPVAGFVVFALAGIAHASSPRVGAWLRKSGGGGPHANRAARRKIVVAPHIELTGRKIKPRGRPRRRSEAAIRCARCSPPSARCACS